MDADEMRRKASACRCFADAAVRPATKAEWLKAADEWEQLALEVEATRKRADEAADRGDPGKEPR
jgi:hypothetical protein